MDARPNASPDRTGTDAPSGTEGRGPAVPSPSTEAGRAAVDALLSAPSGALLAVDYDGTLAPIVADPQQAVPHPDAVPTLARLAGVLGQVAVVTGRPAAVAVSLGGLDVVLGLVVLGHYGLERWEDGTVTAPPPHPGVDRARAELKALLASDGRLAGAALEDKGASVAVHTRPAADPAGALEALRPQAERIAADAGLVVEPGRFVLELRPPGVDKGGALRSLLDGDRRPSAVVYAGDDLGDLAAFDAVDRLRAEGAPGLLLCSGSQEVAALAERADLVLDGPAGLVRFLASLADRLGA
ncbi:MAG TPA: trehalose-phosphatase [Motilibacteraceae bacterium]|nr:trehalose-phosphatase [Motilibacteraceae bacterium]